MVLTRQPILCWLMAFGLFLSISVHAQEADEKSTLIKYVEETISTENFKVGLNGLEGTLSSSVSLKSITLADQKGVWLTIVNPKLVWTRSALLLGKVDVESLTAERVEVTRNPEPDESLPAPEASGFELPQLPVAVLLQRLRVDNVDIAPSVFGLKSVLSVDGKLLLDDGVLDLDLNVQRLDGAGGNLRAVTNYSATSKHLKLDMKLAEPADGLFSNLLGIENRPPVALTVLGDGPLDNYVAKLDFDVDDKRILNGDLRLAKTDGRTNVEAKLAGPLASILPVQHRPFFGPRSELTATVSLADSGEIDLTRFEINSGNLALNVRAKTLGDGFLSALKVDARLSAKDETRVQLPVSDRGVSLSSAQFNIGYDAQVSEGWTASLVANDVEQDGMKIADVTLATSGVVRNFEQAEARSFTFETKGRLTGLLFQDDATGQAVGDAIRISGSGAWYSGSPLKLDRFKVAGDGFGAVLNGQIKDLVFDGGLTLTADRLAGFSGLVKRKLAGAGRFNAKGRVEFSTGGFVVDMNGSTQNLSIGGDMAGRLLNGDTVLTGRISRAKDGLSFEQFRMGNSRFEAEIDGRFSSSQSNLKADAVVHDLADLDDHAKGPLRLKMGLSGDQLPFQLKSEIGIQSGNLQGRTIRDLLLGFTGTIGGNQIVGDLSGAGSFDGKPVKLSGRLNSGSAGSEFTLEQFVATFGNTDLRGELRRKGDQPIDANIMIRSRDIGDLAALALQKASGTMNGTVKMFEAEGLQAAKLDLEASNVRYGENRIGSVDLIATAVDVFGKPKIGATVKAAKIKAAGFDVATLSGKIGTQGDVSSYLIKASVAQHNARVETTGSVQQSGDVTRILVDQFSLRSDVSDVRLRAPTSVSIKNGNTSFTKTTLSVGAGRVVVSGSAGTALNVDVDIKDLPLAIINAVRPETRAKGTVSGRVDISGTADNPRISYKVKTTGFSVRELANAGIAPLGATASGRFANQVVSVDKLQAQNNQNIRLEVSGRIPLSGGGMNLKTEGALPLSLAGDALASRGASVAGTARFNLRVGGSLQSPKPSGLVSVENATFVDPLSNLKLINIGLLAGFDGTRISINRGSAQLSTGGSLSISGSVGLENGYPAKLAIGLNGASYTDGQTFSTQVNGKLTVSGALLRDPMLAGTVNLAKTEIAIPESFAASSQLLDVDHVQPTAGIARTLSRLERATPRARPTARPSVMRLNITVNAPNQIFVRGRGLDAEVGGRIRITGPVNNVQPIGQFELHRGRLSLFGQRVDLTEGRVTLTGDLDPLLDLVAQTDASDVEAFIGLKGRASDLKITFYSNPELPEDEVLARIIFGRAIDELSPAQIVKLASIAAELTGGQSPGLVDSIRSGSGLDDLDIVQDKDGETAIKAGKYISDNVYVGVQAGKKSEATINLDITNDITARGTVDSEGGSSLGVFLEKDY